MADLLTTLVAEKPEVLGALIVALGVHGRGKVPTGGHVRSPRVAK